MDDKIVLKYCSEAIVLIDYCGNVLKINKKAEVIFDIPGKRILGHSFFEIIEKHNITIPFSLVTLKTIKVKHPYSVTGSIQLHNPCEQSYYLNWTIYKHITKDSKKARFILVGKDISEIENYKTCLRDSRIYLKNIIENLPQYVYWKDKDLVYQGCNNLVAQYLGLQSPLEIIGKTDDDFHWSKTRVNFLHKIDETILKDGITDVVEDEIPREDGSVGVMLTSKAPLRNENNEIVGILGVSFDITDRKIIEKELQQAKIAAEAASRAKSEFIANMSHDVRTPITGILGLMQELIDLADNALVSSQHSLTNEEIRERCLSIHNRLIEAVREDGQLILNSVDEILQLLNEILETMRLESGKEPEKAESFDLRELVEHNIGIMQPTARHKKLKLFSEIDENIPAYFSGMRHYLDRTLLNLLSNALKFTNEGFVKIKIQMPEHSQLSYQLNDRVELNLVVEDSGIGIPEDKFEAIFEHFSRLNPSYQGIYKGAGLGLYTVKQYIQSMQSTIKVESEVGKGARFIIKLPLTISDHSDREKISYRLPQANPNPLIRATYHSKKEDKGNELAKTDATAMILIVEDNPVAARAIKSNIMRLYRSCACEFAENGEHALEMAKENNYDLILMDVGLGAGPDGIEVTRQIRALSSPKHAQVPIVAITGHADDPAKKEEAFTAGMQDVFAKPLMQPTLESLIQRYIFNAKNDPIKDAQSLKINLQSIAHIIDWEQCIQLLSDEGLVHELLADLATDLQMSEKRIAETYAAKDEEALRAELHRVRAGIVYLSLPQLFQAHTDFHTAVKAKPQNTIELEKTYGLFKEAISNFLIALAKLDSNAIK